MNQNKTMALIVLIAGVVVTLVLVFIVLRPTIQQQDTQAQAYAEFKSKSNQCAANELSSTTCFVLYERAIDIWCQDGESFDSAKCDEALRRSVNLRQDYS